MEHLRIALGIIIEREDRVLLGLRQGSSGSGLWGFPGGLLEPNEEVLLGGARELREETGLQASRIEPLIWTPTQTDNGQRWLLLFCRAEAQGEPAVEEPDKCLMWTWFGWNEFPDNLFQGPAYLQSIGWPNTSLAAHP